MSLLTSLGTELSFLCNNRSTLQLHLKMSLCVANSNNTSHYVKIYCITSSTCLLYHPALAWSILTHTEIDLQRIHAHTNLQTDLFMDYCFVFQTLQLMRTKDQIFSLGTEQSWRLVFMSWGSSWSGSKREGFWMTWSGSRCRANPPARKRTELCSPWYREKEPEPNRCSMRF